MMSDCLQRRTGLRWRRSQRAAKEEGNCATGVGHQIYTTADHFSQAQFQHAMIQLAPMEARPGGKLGAFPKLDGVSWQTRTSTFSTFRYSEHTTRLYSCRSLN